jgi:HPr kinase/phosphorylase
MKVAVHELTEKAEVLAGLRGMRREVRFPQLNALDLSAPDSWHNIQSSMLHLPPRQVAHLTSLPGPMQLKIVRTLLRQKPACIILSGRSAPSCILTPAESAGIPVVRSRRVRGMTRLLVEKLSQSISLHGVLVQIFGLGTLIIGESAIGKSEAALDLVLRGHKLAADDVVIIERTGKGISGHARSLGADLLQIRGLGIINIRALYGDSATVSHCRIGLVVELEEWKTGQQYAMVGLRERRHRLLGFNVPYLKLPVKTGRNIATLIEVAVRNQMLKNRGIYTARDVSRRLARRLAV